MNDRHGNVGISKTEEAHSLSWGMNETRKMVSWSTCETTTHRYEVAANPSHNTEPGLSEVVSEAEGGWVLKA